MERPSNRMLSKSFLVIQVSFERLLVAQVSFYNHLGGSLVPPGCPSLVPPRLSNSSLPVSRVPPKLSNWSFPASLCLPGASQAVQLVLSCLPGASQAVQLVLSCLALADYWRHPVSLASYHLPGCPNGLSVALGCLPGKQNQIWPWQITGVNWSCLGRLLESSNRGNLGRSPKP